MKRLLLATLVLASLSALFWDAPAYAQVASQAVVVSSCASATYPAGTTRPLTIDTTGVLCSTGSGGGGGGTSSNFGSAFPTAGTASGFKSAAGSTMQPGNLDASGNILVNFGAGATTIVTQPTAANLNATVVNAGTFPVQASIADGSSVTLGSKADAATCATTNTEMACLRQMDADIKGTGNVQGVAASGSTDTDVPLSNGGRAATAAPTAVTDGQKVVNLLGETGKQVVLPYSIKETAVRGTVTSTDTAAHTIIASAGGSLKNYITSLQCGRTDAGATAIVLTLSDAASTVEILPAGGATNILFPVPLATAAATAFSVTSGTGVSTLYCSAQGYTGL